MADPDNAPSPPAVAALVEASDDQLRELLLAWLPGQRWFSGKGHPITALDITSRILVAQGPAHSPAEQTLITVTTSAGTRVYQLWIGWRHDPGERLANALIGAVGPRWAYDALHDQEFARIVIDAIAGGTSLGEIQTNTEPGAVIDASAPAMVTGAEQSNTSLIYGSSAILKFFRRLEPGPNPDAEIHRGLHRAGSTHIAKPLGEIVGLLDGTPTTLGLLTEFLSGSAEGWAMATASVRDLMAEADLRADEVGGDFAAEANRLGRAVAQVHADLASAFGTADADADEGAVIAAMVQAAEEAARHVEALAPHMNAIRRVFAQAAALTSGQKVQRIHGDLHLGQTLRTLQGWAIIDFEGEPSKPLAFRRARHSILRDFAGMLRSFDYAGHHLLIAGAHDAQQAYRAAEWSRRNRDAFSDGYAAAAGFDPRETGALLRAFELDKAIYEVVYEQGHRPNWVPIPLLAVASLTRSGGTP